MLINVKKCNENKVQEINYSKVVCYQNLLFILNELCSPAVGWNVTSYLVESEQSHLVSVF